MKLKINISIFLFTLLISCASDVADDKQINWCLAKYNIYLNNILVYSSGGSKWDIDTQEMRNEIIKLWTNEKTAVEVFRRENNIPEKEDGGYLIREVYFNGDKVAWLEYKASLNEKYSIEYESDNIHNWVLLKKSLLEDKNESALKVCKMWEELSY